MTVKRKSNWYIYFIAFVIALAFAIMVIIAFRWYLFPDGTIPVGLTSTGELSDSFRPTEEYNINMLVMIAEEDEGIPQFYNIAAYNAVEGRVTIIPFPNVIIVEKE